MKAGPDWGPTADLQLLKLRSTMLAWTRQFFCDRGYWEAETPLLSHDVCVDAWLEPFAVPVPDSTQAHGQRTMYLQTSPEFGMKRLLAAGAHAIFQITHSFRQGERGERHNPEFTIVEWYRVGDSYLQQMSLVEELVREFGEVVGRNAGILSPPQTPAAFPLKPFPRLTYDQAFEEAVGCPVLSMDVEGLIRLAKSRQVRVPVSLRADDRDGWLNLLLQSCVEPMLTSRGAVFVQDYPASQAALARVRPEDPPVAERFELYVDGVELCNGYQELTNAQELRRRMERQSRLRAESGLPPLPRESRLLRAMEAGLPECAGVALGFDRLLMTACGCPSIDDVLSFPGERA